MEPVPEADGEERADLRAWWKDSDEYLVEAKGRLGGTEFQELVRKVSDEGMGTLSRSVETSNAFSRRLMKAAEQLQNTPAGPDVIRLIWVYADHLDGFHELECVQKRLLGDAQLVVIDPLVPSFKGIKTCYGYHNNDFRRMPHVHGAILCAPNGFRLIVNHYSPEQDRLRSSHLYQLLTEESAVTDPALEEQGGEAWLVASDWETYGNPADSCAYVRYKYGKRFNVMTGSTFLGLVAGGPLTLAQSEGS